MAPKDDRSQFVRTTIYLPRYLHEKARLMAILTRTNMSYIIRIALSEKIKEIEGKNTQV